MANPSTIFERRSCSPRATRAFTLIEMLIVMGIIVLIIAFAMPAFRFMSGDRSIEAATNILGATLGRARSEALGLQQPRGLAFYNDSTTDRTTAALVLNVPLQAWVTGSTYKSFDYVSDPMSTNPGEIFVCVTPITPSTTHPQADTTNFKTVTPTIAPWNVTSAYAVNTFVSAGGQSYVCIKAVTATVPTPPPHPNPASSPGYWSPVNIIDSDPDTDPISLNAGIDLQLVHDATFAPPNSNTRASDGYVSIGALMFDGFGMLTLQNCTIAAYGRLGVAMNMSNHMPAYTGALQFRSQIGMVLFDRESFKNQGFIEEDPLFLAAPPSYNVGSATDEFSEENWIDQNATPVMINRYNGTLLKGQ